MEEKHEHLLATVQRSFVVRRFCLHLLQEMRLSKLKALAQTDFRATVVEDPDRLQSCAGSALKVGEGNLLITSTIYWSIQHVSPIFTIDQHCQSGREAPGPRESPGEPQLPAGILVRAGNGGRTSPKPCTAGARQRPEPLRPAKDGGRLAVCSQTGPQL